MVVATISVLCDDIPSARIMVVSCQACAHLPTRNGLMNKVEFLGLIPKKW